MIEIQNVEKYFYRGEARELHVLKGINLRIEKGEYALLSGPSGCGKTTLLNVIGALESVDSGDIYFEETHVNSLNEEEQTALRLHNIGFVFQAYNLIPVLSVEENIGFIMKLQGFDERAIAARVLELASLLQIEHKLQALPSTLSGGEQQRVAVARAVAPKPKIILADEPTANLDSKNSQILMEMMQMLNEKEGVSILFASHDEYILQSVKRVIKMKDGMIEKS